jgi:hypothetical protein
MAVFCAMCIPNSDTILRSRASKEPRPVLDQIRGKKPELAIIPPTGGICQTLAAGATKQPKHAKFRGFSGRNGTCFVSRINEIANTRRTMSQNIKSKYISMRVISVISKLRVGVWNHQTHSSSQQSSHDPRQGLILGMECVKCAGQLCVT